MGRQRSYAEPKSKRQTLHIPLPEDFNGVQLETILEHFKLNRTDLVHLAINELWRTRGFPTGENMYNLVDAGVADVEPDFDKTDWSDAFLHKEPVYLMLEDLDAFFSFGRHFASIVRRIEQRLPLFIFLPTIRNEFGEVGISKANHRALKNWVLGSKAFSSYVHCYHSMRDEDRYFRLVLTEQKLTRIILCRTFAAISHRMPVSATSPAIILVPRPISKSPNVFQALLPDGDELVSKRVVDRSTCLFNKHLATLHFASQQNSDLLKLWWESDPMNRPDNSR